MMVQEIKSDQNLKKWCLMPTCFTSIIIRCGSRVSGAIQGKDLCTPLHLGKGAFRLSSTSTSQLIYIYIYIYIYVFIYIIKKKFKIDSWLELFEKCLNYSAHTHTHIYIYIYTERERDGERGKDRQTEIERENSFKFWKKQNARANMILKIKVKEIINSQLWVSHIWSSGKTWWHSTLVDSKIYFTILK